MGQLTSAKLAFPTISFTLCFFTGRGYSPFRYTVALILIVIAILTISIGLQSQSRVQQFARLFLSIIFVSTMLDKEAGCR